MRLRLQDSGGGLRSHGCRLLLLAFLAWIGTAITVAWAHEEPAGAPAADTTAMQSAGWLERITMGLESEAIADVGMLPSTSGAIEREWRTFDRDGSAVGALADLGWVVLAAIVAMLAERAVARGLSRRLLRAMRARAEGPTMPGLLGLLACDIVGVAVFAGVFMYSRHWLMTAGASIGLVLLAANVLIRWRLAALVIAAVLRPADPVARLVDVSDDEARRLARFMSLLILTIVALVGFGRYGLADEDSGASHVIGLFVAAIVWTLFGLAVFRARGAAQALIRGRPRNDIIGAVRAGLAGAWLPAGLMTVTGLLLFFVFGLSLGLLSYYYAVVSTLGILFVLLVLDRLTDRGWHDPDATVIACGVDRLVARGFHRIIRGLVLAIAAIALAWVWTAGIELPAAAARWVIHSIAAAVATLLLAYLAWELTRLAIERHLQDAPAGPRLPGAADHDAPVPGSRLQTILPLMRAAIGVMIAVLAALVVLSHLGIDTAPLIAGAGVFGLAISFGSQSLVRDVISGLFYMWDDAFRVGEYIDTSRLRGTVEALGVRSMKLRHHNGPLHTIPYGQLGSVTNLSRDFATTKFNLRLAPGTDIELVRKTAKQIGLAMQDDPEIAAEVMLPLKLQGIAAIDDNAVVLRFKFTARPIKPSWVQREYLKRMYQVFAEKGIAFASGVLTLQTLGAPPTSRLAEVATPAAAELLAAAPAPVAPLPAPSRVA
jgi:small-conductance mechanosensitive channel